MKTALNGAGNGAGKLGFGGFVDIAARHGFDGVDFGIGGAMEWAKENGGPEALVAFLAEKKITPAVFGLDVEWRKDEETFASGLSALGAKAAFAQSIGANRSCTWLPPSVDVEDVSEWHKTAARRFGEIARVYGEHGIRFGLEWVGPHHLRGAATGKKDWIHDLPGTLALIEDIGLPNVGLLVDCYHCHTTGIGEAELSQLTDTQIVHVHVNDAKRGLSVEELKDGDRILMGEGQIDLAGFVRGLRSAGYSGSIAAEILAPQPIDPDVETAVGKVREALRDMGL